MSPQQIVDNVTFSLPHAAIVVHLVDGSTETLDLGKDGVAQLHRVVEEVQLSFAAAAAPPPPPPPAAAPADSPQSSMSSDRSSSSSSLSPASASNYNANGRRTPSSLLFSLLSPLLPNAPQPAPLPAHVAVHQQPARAHRRQARSLLVDAYRRYVLPLLKDRLPSAYLLWAIHSETTTKMEEFVRLRDEIYALLEQAGIDPMTVSPTSPLRRYHSGVSASCDSDASSRRSSFESAASSSSTSPQNVLLSIPPAHVLPLLQRVAYSVQLTRLTQLASRIGAITKLASSYEREEGKRRWLEQVDLTRDADKAVRRAFSNGLLPRTATLNAVPLRRSPLRQSTTVADVEQAMAFRAARHAAITATAALEDILEAASDEDDEDIGVDVDGEAPELSDSRSSASASPEPRTPTTDRNGLTLPFDDPTPALIPSRSDDSLSERDDWECDEHQPPHLHGSSGSGSKWDAQPPKHVPSMRSLTGAQPWRVEVCR